MFKNLKCIIQVILPGIFLIGYNIGTGSITAMSKAGASFGTALLWTILLSCLITFYLLDRFSLFTIVTGKTFIQGVKKYIHPGLAFFATGSLVIIILAALLGIMGIITDTLQEGTLLLTGREVATPFVACGTGAFLFIILISGRNATFEKVMAVLVALMGLAFITAVVYLAPSLAVIGKGLLPSLPAAAEGSDNSSWVVAAGMTGTTVSSVVFIIRSLLTKDAGWTVRDMKVQRVDAANSAFFMFLISASVLIVAAITLFPAGIRVNNVPEMLHILQPVAGDFAVAVMVTGTAAAGLSSHLPNLLAVSWLIRDYREKTDPLKKPAAWILLLLVLFSISGPIFGLKPVFLMLLSQACLAVLLPVTACSMAWMLHSRGLMGNKKARAADTVIWVIIIVYALLMSGLGIKGLVQDIGTLF